MEKKIDKADCISMLKEKYDEIRNGGEDRYPCRSDFSETEVMAVKAHLGPWPRALEAAGIKPPRDDGFEQRKTEKRIRMKRKRTAAKIAAKKKGCLL